MEKIVDLKRKDFSDYNIYVFFKKRRRRIFLTVFVFAVLIPFLVVEYSPFSFTKYVLTFVLAFIVLGIAYPIGMLLALQFTRFLASSKGSLLGKKTFKISEEGLIEISDSNTNIQRWTSIKSVESNHNAVYIFVDNMVAYIIPNRSFRNSEDQQAFIEAIKEKTSTIRN